MLDEDPERVNAMLDLGQILDRALAGERARISAAEVRERYGVPAEVLDRMAELEVLTPNSRGYFPSDVQIMLESGAQPLRDLIAALHTKLLVAELERQRADRRG